MPSSHHYYSSVSCILFPHVDKLILSRSVSGELALPTSLLRHCFLMHLPGQILALSPVFLPIRNALMVLSIL